MGVDRVRSRRRKRWRLVALVCCCWWAWHVSWWRSGLRGRFFGEVPSGAMWPTHIIGADCPLCGLPMVLAWREVAGTTHPWRLNVEAITVCDCERELMVQALKGQM